MIHRDLVIFVLRKVLFSIVNEATGKNATKNGENEKIRRNDVKAAGFALILSVLASAMPAGAGSRKQDIVDTAVAAGTFNTLATGLQAAGLVDTLKGTGPFTVFAPTDDAFSKLPPGTVESLLKPENREKLKAILLYHVVAGDVTAAQAMRMSSAKTVNGQDLKLTVSGGTVMVNDARVIKADISASNGVIHVIDTVLLPKD
jgi:uncharacterized surface protein with fasciclin (FAS1) repeats